MNNLSFTWQYSHRDQGRILNILIFLSVSRKIVPGLRKIHLSYYGSHLNTKHNIHISSVEEGGEKVILVVLVCFGECCCQEDRLQFPGSDGATSPDKQKTTEGRTTRTGGQEERIPLSPIEWVAIFNSNLQLFLLITLKEYCNVYLLLDIWSLSLWEHSLIVFVNIINIIKHCYWILLESSENYKAGKISQQSKESRSC